MPESASGIAGGTHNTMPANKNDAGPSKKRQKIAPSDDGRDASSTCAMADVELPKSFCCSITMELMRDPVSTADGHTYERAAIARWFADGNATSPNTGAALEHCNLIPNIALRQTIEEWAAKRVQYRGEGHGWFG